MNRIFRTRAQNACARAVLNGGIAQVATHATLPGKRCPEMKAKEAQTKIKPSLSGAACRELSFGTKIARIGCIVSTKACDNEKPNDFYIIDCEWRFREWRFREWRFREWRFCNWQNGGQIFTYWQFSDFSFWKKRRKFFSYPSRASLRKEPFLPLTGAGKDLYYPSRDFSTPGGSWFLV